MSLKRSAIKTGVVVTLALATIIGGCKSEPEPKRDCIDKKGQMVECPFGMVTVRDEIACVGKDRSLQLKTGKRFPPGRIPTSFEFDITKLEMVGPELASVEMTEPLSKVKGYTKVPVCKE